MKISKTQFKNFIRCDRFVALNDIYHEREKAVVSITDDPELEDLMSLENKQFIHEILENMYDEETDEDLIAKTDDNLEMMMPYYNELEVLSAKAIMNKFGGDVLFNKETYKQKRFNYLIDGFDFYCFLDGYQEDSKTIRVFESKATTSSKFSLKGKKIYFSTKVEGSRETEKYEFFVKNSDGIYVPHEDIGLPENSDYYEREKKLFNRLDDVGKYIYDLAYQKLIIEKALSGVNKKFEYYLVILNHEYEFDGTYDDSGKPVYTDDIVRMYNLSSLLDKMMIYMEEDLKTILNRLNTLDARPTKLGKYCERGKTTECPFYDVCYSDFPEKNSIFVYTDRHHGFKDSSNNKYELYELINLGKRSALDIDESLLNRRNNQLQRKVIETGVPHLNKNKIKAGITKLKYPIYHLDFESFNCPLPRFKGETPYTQSLFQYSIHIEHEPGKCDKDKDNYSFLAKDHKDHRRELVESMIDVIKKDGGSVLVYNASFEKTRLKELQKYFPEYFNRLEDIIDRIFDLMDLVKSNKEFYKKLGFSEDIASEYNFYHTDLQGSFSIKKVLPLFSNLKYSDLVVQNGTQAMVTYNNFPKMDENEFNKKYSALIDYCKQDTWAMFEILNKLREI